jgi:hypothetical protein
MDGFESLATVQKSLNESIKFTLDSCRVNHKNLRKVFPILLKKNRKWNKRRFKKRLRRIPTLFILESTRKELHERMNFGNPLRQNIPVLPALMKPR